MTEWFEASFVAQLTPASRTELLSLGTTRTYEPNRQLIREGDTGSYVILLRAGYVKVIGGQEDGRAELLAIRGRGDLVGEMAALGEQPRSATVTTCGNAEVNVIPQGDFLRYLRVHPDANLALTRVMAHRLRQANRRRLDFTGHEAPARIARVLVELIEVYGRHTPAGIRLTFTLTQEELASLSGTSRESVQRTLRALRKAQAVITCYRGFTITDSATLYSAALFPGQNES